jgi:hypothetical protein
LQQVSTAMFASVSVSGAVATALVASFSPAARSTEAEFTSANAVESTLLRFVSEASWPNFRNGVCMS